MDHKSGFGWLRRHAEFSAPRAPDFAALLDALPVSIFVYSPGRGILYVNQRLARRTGRPAESIIGLTAGDLLPAPVAAHVREHEDKALAGQVIQCEIPCLIPGEAAERDLLLSMSACDIAGWGRVVAVSVRDVTKERQVELDLARERDFVQALFDTADALLIVVDGAGRIVRWNRACERITGLHISEVAGREFCSALLDAESAEPGRSLLQRTASGLIERASLSLVARDGKPRYISWSAAALNGDDGGAGFAVLTGVDETPAIAAERKNAESAVEFKAVWASVADLMMFLDCSGAIVAANPVLCRLAGRTNEDLEGRPFTEVLRQWPGHERDEAAQFRARFESRSFPEREVAEYTLCPGGVVWLDMTSSFVEMPGQPPLLLQVGRDITSHVLRERQLRETNEFLESATQWAKEMAASAELASAAKSEFLANVSHEIRTPMNGILGMTELALMTELSPEQRECLEMVQTSAESLLTLLDDILDLSKAEAGRIELQPAPFDLSAELGHLMKPISHRAAAKGLRTSVALAPNLPCVLAGDWNRLRQILLNLLSNAVKFTDNGEVRLRADCLGYEQGLARIRFVVSDTGIGVPSHRISDAFAPFTQLDGSHTRRRGGTGLGLTICASLVDLMGGRLFAGGAEGTGAAFGFVVALPVAGDELPPAPAQPAPVPLWLDRPARCLLAEDNLVNQKLFTAMLGRSGITATLASTGAEAVQWASRDRFDFAIMDVQMPEMDGLEATAIIRAQEARTGGHLPIIAITAHAMPGDRELCLSAGMDGYLSKPVRMRDLLAEIQRLLPSPSATMNVTPELGATPMPMIDYAQALDRVGGDRELLAELAALFLDEYPRLMSEALAGLDNNDLAAASGAAHQLKGLLAQFGSEKGRGLALAVEAAAKSGSAGDARMAHAQLSSHLEEIRGTLLRMSRGEEIV